MEEKIIPFLKEHALALGMGLAGMICLGYGLVSLSNQSKGDSGIDFQSDHQAVTVKSADAKTTKQITVDIEGAVQKPGVYKLNADSRVQDALIASGD